MVLFFLSVRELLRRSHPVRARFSPGSHPVHLSFRQLAPLVNGLLTPETG